MLVLATLLVSMSGTAPAAVQAPVTAATVFSDRARITRTAELPLAGHTLVTFPVLPARVLPESIRLEATGGEVETLTVVPVREDELPLDEVRELLAELDRLDAQIDLAHAEGTALGQIRDALAALVPSAPVVNEHNPPQRLDPSGWVAVMSFLGSTAESLHSRVAASERQKRELLTKQESMIERARQLGAQHAQGGLRVVATLTGAGATKLALTYEVLGARWYPNYDIQLNPARGQVQIAFAGLVDQTTGEDWETTALTLSTAVPAASSEMPKLTAWRIGTDERFVPTPRPAREFLPPTPPPSPPPLPAPEETSRLRQRLQAITMHQKFTTVPTSRPAAPASAPVAVLKQARDIEVRDIEVEEEADMAPAAAAQDEPLSSVRASSRAEEVPEFLSAKRSRPTSVNMAGPAAYRRPVFAANLPAVAAGGYDLAYSSAARESVASGGGARRVALFTLTWPVTVERLIYPALAKEAFLVADIKNPSRDPLPGGHANLFVGDDPAGVADLKFVAPGESFFLPLGVDQAIKPIRNVTQSTEEKGIISKDEVTRYTTTVEVTNPYPTALAARVRDQIPLTANKDRAEVRLIASEPAAQHNPVTGALEWRLQIAPGATTTLKFVYSIKRPKGARLVQQ
jgi:hypothetical protein